MNKEFLISKEKDSPRFLCSIFMSSYSVNIFSEANNFLPYFEGKGVNYIPWIPGWRVDRSPTQSEFSIVYTPADFPRFEFDEKRKTLTVRGDIDEFRDGQALAYLGFWLMEAQRQKDSIVTSHACAVSLKDKGILIFGERGDGKTSVALALARLYGYRLIANDLAIVGFDKGTQTSTIYVWYKNFRIASFSHKRKVSRSSSSFSRSNTALLDD